MPLQSGIALAPKLEGRHPYTSAGPGPWPTNACSSNGGSRPLARAGHQFALRTLARPLAVGYRAFASALFQTSLQHVHDVDDVGCGWRLGLALRQRLTLCARLDHGEKLLFVGVV